MTILEVSKVSKDFTLHNIDGRDVVALDNVTFSIEAGEHVALAGTSGAGKSTLLRVIYRTYRATSGSINLTLADNSRIDLTTLTDHEVIAIRGREIGYVSQFLRAQPRRSVINLVTKAGTARGLCVDAAKELAAQSLRRLNIREQLWDVHTTVLSGGEKQRVNIAAGLISPPRVLLLDEPVSALDPENRERAIEVIAELSKEGVAVLAVFHDLEAIARLASRVVVMSRGRIAEDGPVESVLPHLNPTDVQP